MSSRREEYRQDISKKSPSTQQLREEIRTKILLHRKLLRSDQIAKRRQNFYHHILTDVQKRFPKIELEGNCKVDIPSTEEMLQMIEEIERELKENASQAEADQYSLHLEQNTNALLENFSNFCSICNAVTQNDQSVFCNQCISLHFNSENFDKF